MTEGTIDGAFLKYFIPSTIAAPVLIHLTTGKAIIFTGKINQVFNHSLKAAFRTRGAIFLEPVTLR